MFEWMNIAAARARFAGVGWQKQALLPKRWSSISGSILINVAEMGKDKPTRRESIVFIAFMTSSMPAAFCKSLHITPYQALSGSVNFS